MHKNKIAIIDDEIDLLNVLKSFLEMQDIEVFTYRTYEDFIYKFEKNSLDLIITDLNLPATDGNTLIKEIRKLEPTIPIIMISGYLTKESTLDAIREGANDCIGKPVDFNILLAKIEQLLTFKKVTLKNSLTLDEKTLRLRTGNKDLKLTQTEFRIFSQLNSQEGQMVNREALSEATQSRSLDVHIHSLRKKIEALGMKIETLKGKGYRLKI